MVRTIISQLWVYPIKSMQGILLDSVKLEKRGFKFDRRWMLVNADRQFVSQRQQPKMALIEVKLSEFGLEIRAIDMPVLVIPYPDPDIELFEEIEVTCWDDTIMAQHINTAIDNWFSEFLELDCQLVYMPEKSQRKVDPDYALGNDIVSFSDGFPYLMISEASLDDLNQKVDIELSVNRFRPNIVIAGCEAYAEDSLGHFRINQNDFFAVKPCSRCVITTINPDNAKKESREPLKSLAKYRKKGNKVMFGQNVLKQCPDTESILTVGDIVEVISPSAPLVFD